MRSTKYALYQVLKSPRLQAHLPRRKRRVEHHEARGAIHGLEGDGDAAPSAPHAGKSGGTSTGPRTAEGKRRVTARARCRPRPRRGRFGRRTGRWVSTPTKRAQCFVAASWVVIAPTGRLSAWKRS